MIPDEAFFGGTMRANSDEHIQNLRKRLEQVVIAQAGSFGCNASIDWMEDVHPYYPPLINDAQSASFASQIAAEMLGHEASIGDIEPTMAGEDFAFIASKVPAAFVFLGMRNESAGSVHGLHTAQYIMDEEALPIGSALHTAFALRYLEKNSLAQKDEL